MRSIKNFFHDINDVLLAIIIVAVAAGVIFWRMQVILAYPNKLISGEVVVEDYVDDSEEESEDEPVDEAGDAGSADDLAEEPKG